MLANICFAQQNLVPNPSFEEYSECPNSPGGVGDDELEKAVGWYKPSLATTDYYNSCASNNFGVSVPNNWMGVQEAFHGNAYVGLDTYDEGFIQAAEYVQCRLKEPLKPCYKYEVRFWVSLSDYSARSTNSLGLRLDDHPIMQSSPFDFWGFELPPHISTEVAITDTASWTLINSEYIASGGEQYLTIGRFLDTTFHTNYNPPFELFNCDSCSQFGLFAYYYIDSVSVVQKDPIEPKSLIQPNVITANNDGINDCWLPYKVCGENWTCTILNRWGNIVFEFAKGEPGWCGHDQGDHELAEGVYYFIITDPESDIPLNKGFIHLVR